MKPSLCLTCGKRLGKRTYSQHFDTARCAASYGERAAASLVIRSLMALGRPTFPNGTAGKGAAG